MELRGYRRANKPQSGLFSRHYFNGRVVSGAMQKGKEVLTGIWQHGVPAQALCRWKPAGTGILLPSCVPGIAAMAECGYGVAGTPAELRPHVPHTGIFPAYCTEEVPSAALVPPSRAFHSQELPKSIKGRLPATCRRNRLPVRPAVKGRPAGVQFADGFPKAV